MRIPSSGTTFVFIRYLWLVIRQCIAHDLFENLLLSLLFSTVVGKYSGIFSLLDAGTQLNLEQILLTFLATNDDDEQNFQKSYSASAQPNLNSFKN